MLNVAIYIYPDAEVLDFSGPFEVFSTANRVAPELCFEVFLVAQTAELVTARGGYQLMPHFDFSNHPSIDLLLVVGGVHNEQLQNPVVMSWVSETAARAKLVASVCTGAFILAKAGVLDNLQVTTHWEDISDLRSSFANLDVVENKRWVDTGKYLTSGGISAGIDMSLHLVERLVSREIAEKTARQMEYRWCD
ncbi:DJ-1/PfpI family protein [Alteromonadaceae bacterium 2753L.S.0a.02]|nr:DJ-1/PfpI family protein [Alteromonadaceae bacterium 2753L.S.0a.02]